MTNTGDPDLVDHAVDTPPFLDALKAWMRIGLLSFGGPAAQIALMHRVIVNEKRWLTEQQYLTALSFCMLLPGPEAMQLATYSGWRLHGWRGGLAAGISFVLPGALVILVLAMAYSSIGHIALTQALFLGIKAAVVVIVVEALIRISKRSLKGPAQWWIAGLSFVGIFFFQVPFPLIIFAAGLFGYVSSALSNVDAEPSAPVAVHHSHGKTVLTIMLWTAVWMLPLLALMMTLGTENIMTALYVFFSKLAVVTFGGAYSVLAYMGQDVVTRYGWMEAGQMMDALGLAETTPGPLILVTEFVGYVAADTQATSSTWPMGLFGAGIALWATFVPCFLWIFAFAPYVERINHQPRAKASLAAISAAVAGVILNLSLWFALHVYFDDVQRNTYGLLTLWIPDLATLNWQAVVITLVCGLALLRFRMSILWVIVLSAILGYVSYKVFA